MTTGFSASATIGGQQQLGQFGRHLEQHLGCGQARRLGPLHAIEPVERERDLVEHLADPVERPEVVQPSPPIDHRHRVQPTVERGVGEQVPVTEQRQGRPELLAHPHVRGIARAVRDRRLMSRSARTRARSASPRCSSVDEGSAIVALRLRSSVSIPAISGSSGGRTSGRRDDINRVASIRSSSSRGRPSAIARRAPSSVSAYPWTAA